MKYTNFFETLKEAHARLRNTIILYDGDPYSVAAITDHKKDGIFRIYLDIIDRDRQTVPTPTFYNVMNDYSPEQTALGGALDAWLDANPKSPIIRKQMNSPLFNQFRPFPLGMINWGNNVFYLERQPLRPKMEQGLIKAMVTETPVDLGMKGRGEPRQMSKFSPVDIYTPAFKACVKGEHPSAKECLNALTSGQYANEAIAFHRDFAFVVGPVGLVFLAYKGDVVAVLPKGDFSYLKMDAAFIHTKEVIEKLSLFDTFI